MIYLLSNEDYFVSWLPRYVSNLKAGFEYWNEDVEMIKDVDREFKETDSLIIVDYKDLPVVDEIEGTKPVMISHSHGSSAFFLGAKATGDIEKEKRELKAVDLVMCNTIHHYKKMVDFGVTAHFTGYPIDYSKIEKFKKDGFKKDKIVVGGRVEQDRQLFLAVETLRPYGKRVHFCIPHDRESAVRLWGGDTIKRYEEHFNFHWNMGQEEFYKELSDAEFVTTFGCVDTLNLSVIEGITLGAYPLVPKKLPYREYVSEGYEPYSIKDFRKMFREKPPIKYNLEQYDYRQVASRYLSAISHMKHLRRR